MIFKVGDRVKFLGFNDTLETDTRKFIGIVGAVTAITPLFVEVDYEPENNKNLGGTIKNILNFEEELELVNEQ